MCVSQWARERRREGGRVGEEKEGKERVGEGGKEGEKEEGGREGEGDEGKTNAVWLKLIHSPPPTTCTSNKSYITATANLSKCCGFYHVYQFQHHASCGCPLHVLITYHPSGGGEGGREGAIHCKISCMTVGIAEVTTIFFGCLCLPAVKSSSSF